MTDTQYTIRNTNSSPCPEFTPDVSSLAFLSGATSTSVENPLQISSFMQNKPNLVRRRRIANSVFIEDYENEPPSVPKKTNPKQTQYKPNSCGFLLEFIPHNMRGRNNIFLPDVLFPVTMNRCFSENVIMTILSFWKNIEKTLVLRKKYGRK